MTNSSSVATTNGTSLENGHSTTNGTTSTSTSITRQHRLLPEIPVDYGLLLWLDHSSGTCYLTYTPDDNYHDLHPNIYAPLGLTNVEKLRGGGSGVTVFSGQLPSHLNQVLSQSSNGSVDSCTAVMKHGSYKDTMELFALATIAHELQQRGQRQDQGQSDVVHDMQSRIPQFKYLYLSPKHFRERHAELWSKLKATLQAFHDENTKRRLKRHMKKKHVPANCAQQQQPHGTSTTSSTQSTTFESYFRKRSSEIKEKSRHGQLLATKPSQRVIRLYSDVLEETSSESDSNHSNTDHHSPIVSLEKEFLDICLDKDSTRHWVTTKQGEETKTKTIQYGEQGNGYHVLKSLVDQLLVLQEEHYWKFTCAQTTIGGPEPTTASLLLAKGLLSPSGPLLPQLLEEFIQVIRHLQHLTCAQEQSGHDLVVQELETLKQEQEKLNPSLVSKLANSFVGGAIHKNFHPHHGRYIKLRNWGIQFRTNPENFILQPQERIPAYFLGILLQANSKMNQAFLDTPPLVIPNGENLMNSWLSLLEQATTVPNHQDNSTKRRDAKLNRLWTCGFTDAGLHNLFLSSGKLWLFDLGEPTLQPLPAFLTKFLFSFFHTLGMEEDPNSSSGDWVKRFVLVENETLLALTDESKQLLKQAHAAFATTLDTFVKELFHGDDTIRPLLLRYMTLQLLSDCAFCLQKWTIKGGGQKTIEGTTPHQHHNEKWLWRALWDVYVAFDVNTKTW